MELATPYFFMDLQTLVFYFLLRLSLVPYYTRLAQVHS